LPSRLTLKRFTDGLGQRYRTHGASIKKWCVGSPIQAALDALLALMTEPIALTLGRRAN
jgi:hypothetical protein